MHREGAVGFEDDLCQHWRIICFWNGALVGAGYIAQPQSFCESLGTFVLFKDNNKICLTTRTEKGHPEDRPKSDGSGAPEGWQTDGATHNAVTPLTLCTSSWPRVLLIAAISQIANDDTEKFLEPRLSARPKAPGRANLWTSRHSLLATSPLLNKGTWHCTQRPQKGGGGISARSPKTLALGTLQKHKQPKGTPQNASGLYPVVMPWPGSRPPQRARRRQPRGNYYHNTTLPPDGDQLIDEAMTDSDERLMPISGGATHRELDLDDQPPQPTQYRIRTANVESLILDYPDRRPVRT